MLNYLMLVLNIANLFYYYCLNIKKKKKFEFIATYWKIHTNVEAGIH